MSSMNICLFHQLYWKTFQLFPAHTFLSFSRGSWTHLANGVQMTVNGYYRSVVALENILSHSEQKGLVYNT